MTTMTFDKILSELDAFPELGMDRCQANLIYENCIPMTLLYEGGKLVNATLLADNIPVDITANAVMMNGVPREIPTQIPLMVSGIVASELPMKHLRENDRILAFQFMPDFDFWASYVNAVSDDSRLFADLPERRLWLDQIGFRTILEYDVQGSRGLRKLAQALEEGTLGPLPKYIRTDSLAISRVSVYSGVYEVKIPKTAE